MTLPAGPDLSSLLGLATCASVGLLPDAGTFSHQDMTLALQPDGYCYALTIENRLAQATNESDLIVAGDVTLRLIVRRGHSDRPDHVDILPEPGWTADPAHLLIADNDSATSMICPGVGA